MGRPPIRYHRAEDGSEIAYTVVGDGPVDVLFGSDNAFNIDLIWDYPPAERFLRRLASFARLVLWSPRGFPPSDPVPLDRPAILEEQNAALLGILDHLGTERVAFVAGGQWCLPVLFFAATWPDRTSAIVVIDGYASWVGREGFAWGVPPEQVEQLIDQLASAWGTGATLQLFAPDHARDASFVDWYARMERLTVSRGTLRSIQRMVADVDIRAVLPTVRVPALVISHREGPLPYAEHGRYLAGRLPNARRVERPGWGGLAWLHDTEATLDEIESFLTGERTTAAVVEDRVLATLLFTDIVGSTERAASLGDERWRWLLDRHDRVMRAEVERFRGHLVKGTGDGLLASFDGPARAIRCGLALRAAAAGVGLDVRVGLHTGEVELRDGDLGGIAVHIAARVMDAAGTGEVVVSGAIPPLVAGSGIQFDDLGARTLKGVPGAWRLLRVRE